MTLLENQFFGLNVKLTLPAVVCDRTIVELRSLLNRTLHPESPRHSQQLVLFPELLRSELLSQLH